MNIIQVGAVATSLPFITHAQLIDGAYTVLVALVILLLFVCMCAVIRECARYCIGGFRAPIPVSEVAQALQSGACAGCSPQVHICTWGHKRCPVCQLACVKEKLDRDIASLESTRAILREIVASRNCGDS